MKVVQVGCGKMSAYTMRYVLERQGELVGAYDVVESVIGKDVSEIIGGDPLGVIVEPVSELDASLKRVQPDIAIITTKSLVASIYPVLEVLAANHVNGVSICEELFYAWDSNPGVSKKIDELAKANGVTFTGSGYQDVSWGSMVTALAATAASFKKVHGISSYDLEDYGLETAAMHGAGLTMEQFQKEILDVNNISQEEMERLIAAGEFLPGYMWPVNGWVASALGLHVTKMTQTAKATTHTEDLFSKTLGRVIPAGDATGLLTVVTSETEEGVTVVTECIGAVFAPGEFDVNEWRIEGEPDMRFVMERPATVEMTCACAVNRLPDVIAAEPGYVTSEKLPDLKFRRTFA
ncbi:MAG: dihydrodipicolinate reductase [Bifidobacteriaceae bacterium]|jgi:4-hydroxy-tetrahydrodipicolinate reductase|nr:dihydrodipicolinate reductase [Bifidobacteriaceae bacterium]